MSSYNDRHYSGSVYILFGPFKNETIDVAHLEDRGFRIDGASEDHRLGLRVAGLGDVNGDGLDDVLMSAPDATNPEGEASGVAYVVFGKATTSNIDLLTFHLGVQGDTGFRIDGSGFLSLTGDDIDDVGDMNRDGLNDMVIGAPFAGSTYVVFGKSDNLPVDLEEIGEGPFAKNGFRISHPTPPSNAEETFGVAGVGDVNGDDTPDLYVDSCYKQVEGGETPDCVRTRAWVIFGKSDSRLVRVRNLDSGGFVIRTAQGGSGLSLKPGGAGDINFDGKADLVVLSGIFSKNAYVIFGKETPEAVDLNELKEAGYRIKGWADDSDRTPFELGFFLTTSPAGYLDGDRVPDFLVSARNASPRGRDLAGSVFVIYGNRKNRSLVNLKDMDHHGYRVDGSRALDQIGVHISATPDLNGDTDPDLIIDSSFPGRIDVLWGRSL